VAGVLSIVDLLGRGATAQPYAQGTDACPKESIEHDCDIHLRELLRATKIELIAFRFPHRKNFGFFGVAENRSEDAFNTPYVFENFPRTVDKFNESMRSSEED
jgi:hypothetical protein